MSPIPLRISFVEVGVSGAIDAAGTADTPNRIRLPSIIRQAPDVGKVI
jgi:hypothetical protein